MTDRETFLTKSRSAQLDVLLSAVDEQNTRLTKFVSTAIELVSATEDKADD